MAITGIVPQLRTTDMDSSIRFYTKRLGFSVEFNYRPSPGARLRL